MSEVRLQETPDYKPGTFCWVELATIGADAAKSFYTQLFDWDYVDSPTGPGTFTMFKVDGKDIGALYELPAVLKEQGIQPHWLSYISVASVNETVKKAKDEGATVLKEPTDIDTVGRMAVIQDPTGAVFALWQAGTHKGAAIYNVPNTFCWNELGTSDTAKAGEFYSNMFGWTRDTQNFGSMQYTMFRNGDRGAGGMYEMTPEMGPIPPHWLVYFAVDDCDAKVRKATQLGARVMKPADDIPGVGRFAILIDPQGAAFAIIKLENPE